MSSNGPPRVDDTPSQSPLGLQPNLIHFKVCFEHGGALHSQECPFPPLRAARYFWSMSGWCRGYWSSQGRVEKGWNWVAECNNIGERYTRKNVLFLRRGQRPGCGRNYERHN